jgi:hypothetical protein
MPSRLGERSAARAVVELPKVDHVRHVLGIVATPTFEGRSRASFSDRGSHALKDVPGKWPLLAAHS